MFDISALYGQCPSNKTAKHVKNVKDQFQKMSKRTKKEYTFEIAYYVYSACTILKN